MNYKVLYRKYRPDDFENIVGQDYIVRTLKNSIISKNISHAYIFSGPRGTGKTTTAKVFSKAINCLQNNLGSPCGNCEFCKNFLENPDIIEIDAASNNGVDEIRNLIDNIKLTPTNGQYKVYIIDEVHMLTTSAFNALLLTLEEPPKHAIFILATTNIENVPITILSRCQRFDFQKINITDIVDRLEKICLKENIIADKEALEEIAYLSEGGMRDALSLLDQLSKDSQKITLDLVESQIKIVSKKTLKELFENIENNDINSFFKIVNSFRNQAVDYKNLIKKIIENASEKAKNIKITGKMKRLCSNDYRNMVIDLADSLNKININIDPYTILEMLLLEYFDTSNTIIENSPKTIENNEVKNNDLEKVKNIDEIINVRINNCFVNAQKTFLENYKKLIDNFVSSTDILGKVKSLILDTKVVAASDKNIIFSCESEHVAESANNCLQEIEKNLESYSGKKLKLIFISGLRWENEKKIYIDNLKNNIKYSYIDEKEIVNNDEQILSDIFDISKVEII